MAREKTELAPYEAPVVEGSTVDQQVKLEASALIEASWRGRCDRVHVEAALRRLYDRGCTEGIKTGLVFGSVK